MCVHIHIYLNPPPNPSNQPTHTTSHDIQSLHIKSLRAHLGLVSQEPTLFATTIAENIAYGAPGASGASLGGKGADLGVARERIEAAAKAANAHDFIVSFPDGYETQVGEMGVQLSGGKAVCTCVKICVWVIHDRLSIYNCIDQKQ